MRLGIDFGTCLSSAAVVQDGALRLVKEPLRHGFSFPSAVYATPSGELRVGQAAENDRPRDPVRYQHEFKRDLGKRDQGKSISYLLGERWFSPEELLVALLTKLRSEAEKMLPAGSIRGAVLTVPAPFQRPRRDLVREAGERAGLGPVELLDEPVAAALAYGRSPNKQALEPGTMLLVYDLGGGTFDAALLRRTATGFELLAQPLGLDDCGGCDFDRAIFEDLMRRCGPALRTQLEADDLGALRARAAVWNACRDLKHQLTEANDAEVWLTQAHPPEAYSLTRADFERLIEPFLEQTVELCRRLVTTSGVSAKNRAALSVLMVGGSCRIPCVGRVLQQAFGQAPLRVDDPELAVCQGAAFHAAALDQAEQASATPVVPPERLRPVYDPKRGFGSSRPST